MGPGAVTALERAIKSGVVEAAQQRFADRNHFRAPASSDHCGTRLAPARRPAAAEDVSSACILSAHAYVDDSGDEKCRPLAGV